MNSGNLPAKKTGPPSVVDRRHSERRDVVKPAAVKFTYEVVELEARTVNISREGISLEALGRIPLLIEVDGKKYRGHLVRAVPMDPEWTAYAVALDDDLDI